MSAWFGRPSGRRQIKQPTSRCHRQPSSNGSVRHGLGRTTVSQRAIAGRRTDLDSHLAGDGHSGGSLVGTWTVGAGRGRPRQEWTWVVPT